MRLNFEPSGRPKGQAGDYYMGAKENKCVVCGQTQNNLRKYIVPHEYRKEFPEVMRDHQSHDVLLMCLNCHQKSNLSDQMLRNQLNEMCGIQGNFLAKFDLFFLRCKFLKIGLRTTRILPKLMKN